MSDRKSHSARRSGFSIREVVRISGISASNLRQWEARYGWPTPIRLANGYRYYPPELVEDIKKVKDHLDIGHRIGDLVTGGELIWEEEVLEIKPTRSLRLVEQLPQPGNREAQQFRRAVNDGLGRRDIPHLHEMLERAAYQLRWQDLNLAVLMPIAAGLFEQNYHATSIDPAEEHLIDLVGRTATRHASRMTISGGPIGVRIDDSLSDWLVPCIVLVLRERGLLAEADEEGDLRLVVRARKNSEHVKVFVDGEIALADLFDWQHALPWSIAEVC